MIHRLNGEVFLGFAGLAFGYAFLRQAERLMYPSNVYPVFIAFLIMGISVLIALRGLLRPPGSKTSEISDPFTSNTFVVMATVIAYTTSVTVIGFYVSSFFCILFLSVVTARARPTRRSFTNSIVAAFVFLGAVYFIFSYTLRSSISQGLLF